MLRVYDYDPNLWPSTTEKAVGCFRDPGVIHAMCEDYRAGAMIDYALDEADLKSGRKIGCPMLALWGGKGRLHKRT